MPHAELFDAVLRAVAEVLPDPQLAHVVPIIERAVAALRRCGRRSE